MNLKKTFLITALILAPLLLTANNANANMFNKFKKGFYFEKYKTADEANVALLKLHPIGSNVDELVKTLEKAGAKLNVLVTRQDATLDRKKEKYFFKGLLSTVEPNHYRYDAVKVSNSAVVAKFYEGHTGFIISPLLWKIGIWYDKNNNITDVSILKEYMGL